MIIYRNLVNKTYKWLILCVLLFSCTVFNKKYPIPEKKLIPLLVDLHIADGIAVSYRIVSLPEGIDSTALYSSVFEKHGITRAQFDSTMSYYTNHPDDLSKIYERVVERLNKLESEIRNEEIEAVTRKETVIWQDKKSYLLPADGRINRISFSIPTTGLGEYIIQAKIKVYKDDESLAPKLYAYFWHDNGTENGYREYFISRPIRKDKILNSYKISKKLNNRNITHIKGYIYDHSNQDTLFTKHAYITGIKIVHRNY